MRRFIVIDEFTRGHRVVADTADARAAAMVVAAPQLPLCLSDTLVEVPASDEQAAALPGVRVFVDAGTSDGWGPGCRFDGRAPKHQVILLVVPMTGPGPTQP